jgi:pSer/pThr/pTyr-binding forkhead associated (FHA) protein
MLKKNNIVVLMIEEDKQWWKYSSSIEEIKIGRSSENDIVIKSALSRVSRNHCIIRRKDEFFYVCDLDSINGTYLDYSRLEPNKEYPLHHRAIVSLGGLDRVTAVNIIFLTEDEFGEARITEAGRTY